MLELLHALARRLSWLRWAGGLITLASLGLFGLAAISQNAPTSFFTSGIAGALWGVLLFVFVSVFADVPAKAPEDAPGWRRFTSGIRRLGYWCLALLTFGLTAFVASLSFRLLGAAAG